MSELDIPADRFQEFLRADKELDHARKVYARAQEIFQIVADNLIQKEQIYEDFLVSINAPLAEVIELRPHREDLTA